MTMDQALTLFISIFKWVLVTSLSSSLIALLILLIRAIFKQSVRPRWFTWLWLVLIVRLIMPWIPESSLSLFNVMPLFSSYIEVESLFSTTIIQPQQPPSDHYALNPALSDTYDVAHPTSSPPTSLWFTTFSMVWIAGVLVGSIHLYRHSRRIRMQLAGASMIDDPAVLSVFENYKQRLKVGANIRLMHHSGLTSPALYRLLRPRFIVPSQQLTKLNEDEWQYIICHELAHHKHRDIAISWLMSMVLLLHWFNPLLRYCYACMREDQELASDYLVLTHLGENKAIDYGYAMIEMMKDHMQFPVIAGTANFISNKAQLERRLKMIRTFRKGTRWRLVLGLSLVLLFASVSLSNAKIVPESATAFSIPDGWEAVQSGHETIYISPSLSSADGQVSISIIDYKGIEARSYDIPQLRIYDETPDLRSWLDGIQSHFAESGIVFEQVKDPSIGPLLIWHDRNYVNVILYIFSPRPYAVSLVGTGKFSNVNLLKEEGYYDIFLQLATSVSSGRSL